MCGRWVGGIEVSGLGMGDNFFGGRLGGGCLVWWAGDLVGDWEAGLGMSEGYKVGLGQAERWDGWHAGGNWLGEGGSLEGCTVLGMTVVAFYGGCLG